MKTAPLWALAGALAFYILQPSPPAPDYPSVIVHREMIEAKEPAPVVKWKDRLVVVTPRPMQIATAPGGATGLVSEFCRPTLIRAQGDTARAAAEPRTLLLRSGSLDRGWPLRPDRLRLTGPDSRGDLIQGTWATHGSSSFRVVGDSVLVRYDRWWLPKEAAPYAIVAGVTYLLARTF